MTSSSGPSQGAADVSGYSGREAPESKDVFRLSHEFYSAYKEYEGFKKRPGSAADAKALIEKFNKVVVAIRELSIMSPNEELDDINTVDLKYVVVPFCMGDLCRFSTGVEGRKKMLQDGLVFYGHFMQVMLQLKIVTEVQYDQFSEKKKLNGSELREVKIARYKESKELDAKVSILFARKMESDDEEFNLQWGSGGSLDEEDVRDLVVALLKRAVLTVLDESKFMIEEIPLLEMMENKVPVPPKPEKPTEPWILRLQDKAALHMYWKDRVLKPFHNLPTMSLQEWAEKEMENAIHGTGEEKKYDPMKDEDNWEYDEARAKKAREWDDFTDHVKKGSGNRGGNMG
eukprot:gene676-413_t